MSKRVHNFGAGPGALPHEVLKRAQSELLNYSGMGLSVMEMSHRHQAYERLQEEAEQRLRRMMRIPASYNVLFLQGGASLQFAMIPMNYVAENARASYVLTGAWSEKAFAEAKRIGAVHVAGSTKDEDYRRIPQLDELNVASSDAYLHITTNNTIFGSQWHQFPNSSVPLVADMSSDILSRELEVDRFHMIYAGAQKNLGPAGVTVVVIHSQWLEKARRDIPTMLRYDVHAGHKSLYNTPPTFSVYILGLVLEWIEEQGGVPTLEQRNQQKASLVYSAIDHSGGFYGGHVEASSRSNMNITFRLPNAEYETAFFRAASERGFVGLEGHRSVGGCRASLYNAVSVGACERLSEFMADFRRERS